jgi:hypothetical protein
MLRCPNTVLQNLPMGFTTDKPTTQLVTSKGSALTSEYEVPVGGVVSKLKETTTFKIFINDKYFFRLNLVVNFDFDFDFSYECVYNLDS